MAPRTIPSAAADRATSEMLRVLASKTETERLQIAWGMWRSARKMLQRIVTAEHPELTGREQDQITARRMSHGS